MTTKRSTIIMDSETGLMYDKSSRKDRLILQEMKHVKRQLEAKLGISILSPSERSQREAALQKILRDPAATHDQKVEAATDLIHDYFFMRSLDHAIGNGVGLNHPNFREYTKPFLVANQHNDALIARLGGPQVFADLMPAPTVEPHPCLSFGTTTWSYLST